MDLLRLLTAGSVDDGKSTLIGRLLYDANCIPPEQLAALQHASRQMGSEEVELGLLVDGLKAEREQGITIDVAYRYCTTPKRKFIIADCPGHVQYTRNMVTGASNCTAAVILVDARHGVLEQTKRHTFIVSLLQIPHIIVAVNKMDLVGYRQEIFDRIVGDYQAFAAKLSVHDLRFVPVSALEGDNVVQRSAHMPWYEDAPLLHQLETIYISADDNLRDCRFPVQYVIRPRTNGEFHDYRGYAGTVVGGIFKVGDEVMVLPSGSTTTIAAITCGGQALAEACPPQSAVLQLHDDLDISRGDMIVRRENAPTVSQDLDCMVCWLGELPLDPRRRYVVKHTTRTVKCVVKDILYKVDIHTLHRNLGDKTVGMNDIARVRIKTTAPLFFDPYVKDRTTGSLIFIDEATNDTVAAGMIR